MSTQDTTSTKSKLTNELHIVGRVATEPKKTEKGPHKFRLGHGGGGHKKDGTPWPTQWFSVTCWSETAMEGVVRGAHVEIFGKLRDSTYTAKDGTVKYGTEILAEALVVQDSEEQPAPITPKTSGTATTRALLRPAGGNDGEF